MFELVFLGTAASAPTVQRNLVSAMVLHREHRFLVDCGEGTQRQIMRSGLGFKRLDKILLTHGHLDHILGLGGIAATMARWGNLSELTIYGGRWALERVRALMDVVLRGDEVALEVYYELIRSGPVLSTKHVQVQAVPVHHRGPGNFGFIFEEPTHRPFLVEEAEALGVPAGPERRQLVQGEPITLADGRIVHPDQVLGPPVRGTKLGFLGDTARVDNLGQALQGSDALVMEATYLACDTDLARRFGHLTALEAAQFAREVGAGHLYLTHISQRYPPQAVLEEAQAVFPQVTVASDLDRFSVRREDED
ncbi:MAG: MBL fold metallo-hydrolase [Chloroflexia bacterium]|nr:MBL fold metallo-hydrolase [Chloroflexia bacterium]